MDWKSLLARLVDTSKLAGYVRAGVAAAAGAAIAKWPLLGQFMDQDTQNALGVFAAGLVVGMWSHFVKSDDAKKTAIVNAAKKTAPLLMVGVMATALAGCWSTDVNTSVSRNTLYAVTNSYGVLLSAAQSYKALPLCRTGTSPGITNICAKRSVIVRLQAADARVVKAISDADAFMTQYPTIDATNVIAAAQSALTSFQSVVAETGAN